MAKSPFDIAEYKHMKMFPLLRTIPLEMRIANEYRKRAPFFMQCYDRYDKGYSVIWYTILVYDKQSPLRIIYPLLDQRKEEAAVLCGLHKQPYYAGIADFSDAHFVDALNDFLKMRDDIVWALIIQNEETFYSNQYIILSQVKTDGKDSDRLKAAELQSKLLAMQNQIRRELKALWAEFTGNDPDAEASIKDRRPFSPEVVSRLEIDFQEDGYGEEE
jgi:hypothetical protein